MINDKTIVKISIDGIINCFRYTDKYKSVVKDIIKSQGPEEYDEELSGTASDEQWIASICVAKHEREVLLKRDVEDLLKEYKSTIRDFAEAIEDIVEAFKGDKNE
tara:strand:- start:102 stop:416 length:315 start_codon:yes stop_codon:yes gene_type:complete